MHVLEPSEPQHLDLNKGYNEGGDVTWGPLRWRNGGSPNKPTVYANAPTVAVESGVTCQPAVSEANNHHMIAHTVDEGAPHTTFAPLSSAILASNSSRKSAKKDWAAAHSGGGGFKVPPASRC